MARTQSLGLGVACLLLLAAASDAVQTTGSIDVKLVFENMSLDTFEKKYQDGAAAAIAAAAGVPADYVTYKPVPAAASAGSADASAGFAIRTTDEPWAEQTMVRRKLLASAAGSGSTFYSHLAKQGVPFRPAVSVNDIEILGGSQAGAWDTPKSRFGSSNSSSDSAASEPNKQQQAYLTPQDLAAIAARQKDNDSSNSSSSTAAGAASTAAPAAATAGSQAPAASSQPTSGPAMVGSLPMAVFIPVVVLGSLVGLLALTALAVSLYRLCRACGCCCGKADRFTADEEAAGAPVDGSGVVYSGSEDEGYVSASPNSISAAKGYSETYEAQQHYN